MGGGRVSEVEAVERQPGLLSGPEGSGFDCLIDVRGGCGDQLPADRVEQDELVAGVEARCSAARPG